MDPSARNEDPDSLEPSAGQIVSMELIVQSRAEGSDFWTSQGDPLPGLFIEHAREYLTLRRTAYPQLKSRLIRRLVVHHDEVLED